MSGTGRRRANPVFFCILFVDLPDRSHVDTPFSLSDFISAAPPLRNSFFFFFIPYFTIGIDIRSGCLRIRGTEPPGCPYVSSPNEYLQEPLNFPGDFPGRVAADCPGESVSQPFTSQRPALVEQHGG